MRAMAGKPIVAVSVALACLTVGAGPAAGRESAQFPLIAEFELRGSKDYRVGGFVLGNLAAIQARSARVAAQYMVSGRREGDRFTARFGRLGRVTLEFHPASPRRGCRPFQRGTYRGRIDFTGERHYTEVHADAVRGVALANPSPGCDASSSASSPFTILTHLHAIAKRPSGAAALSAMRLARGRAFVLASLDERRGRMSVTRTAFALVGGRNAFLASAPGKHPAFAYLKPPKPFAGSAVFEETGVGAGSWNGNLSAWLPGLGRVAFAGPGFSSNLCRRSAGQPGCPLEPTVRRPLALLQGSGSQSQLLAEARLSWSRYLRNSDSSAGSTP